MSAAIWRIVPVLLFGCWLGIAVGQQASIAGIQVVTVCEALHDPTGYNGKSIVVVGRFVYTSEGKWLSEDCERKIVTDGYTWANIISTTYVGTEVEPPPGLPKGFKWDREILMKKLKEVQATTKLTVLTKYNYRDRWVAMFGRFETRIPPQVAMAGDGRFKGYGFGHLNAAPAQLISSGGGFRELGEVGLR